VTELGLPERGSLGLSVNLGEPLLSLEMTYESHPGEVLLAGGGMAGVAAAGVLAAVALPAYQDYTIGAQVSEGLNLAAAAKVAVAAAWAATGEVPADSGAAGLAPEPTLISGRDVQSIDISNGQLVIRYGAQSHPQLAGRVLVLTPYTDNRNGNLIWACGHAPPPAGAEPIGGTDAGPTSLEDKYLPAVCRSGSPNRIAAPMNIPIAASF
jgi:type IV pilus assembly protein PilA